MHMLAGSAEVARRRRHPQAHPHRRRGGRGHRRDHCHHDGGGHPGWLPAAAGACRPARSAAGVGDREHWRLRRRADPVPARPSRAGGRVGSAQAGRPPPSGPPPTRWMRPGPPVTSWPSPERPGHEPRCRCGWRPAARRSRPPAMPNASSTPWSLRHLRSYGNGSGPARPASWWPPVPGSGSTPIGMYRPRARQRRCGAWPAGSESSPPRPPTTRQAILVLVRAWRPDLLTRTGVGPIVAATVLCALVPCRPLPL
jgi:hypothetical protein